MANNSSFTRRTPDIMTEELGAFLSQKVSYEFKPLSNLVYPNLHARNAASGGDEFRMNSYVVDEINAYVAIRDLALAEAEKDRSPVNLERVRSANDFVENCLKPARSPYESQHLPETDAARERGRCQAVKVRLFVLRAHPHAISRDHAHTAPGALPEKKAA